MPSRLTVQETLYYDASPAKVFAALTEPKKLSRWFVRRAEITLAPNAPFTFVWRGGYSLRGRVKTVVPGRSLCLSWPDRFGKGRAFLTEARFDLRKKGRGTVLKITHSGFKSGPAWVRLHGAVQAGWAYHLLNLRAHLSHGVDLRVDQDSIA
ncbi:MAG: SRPBCC family protein [Thermoplasmata archaeon]